MHRVIFYWNGLVVYSYGLMIALGALVSTFLMLQRAEDVPVNKNDLVDVIIFMLLGGIIGGRIVFVLTGWEYFQHNLLETLMVWQGGLAFQGSLLGGALAVWVMLKRKNIPFWSAVDTLIPYVAIGQSFGRLGCYLNGCCYGLISEGPFSVTFPGQIVMRVPTQILYSLGHVLIFIILRSYQETLPSKGRVLALYLMLFSLMRFFFDFLRGDELSSFAGFHLTQILAIGLFLCGMLVYFYSGKLSRK